MAQHMSSILGSALVTTPLGDGMPKNFPSPEVGILLDCFIGSLSTKKKSVVSEDIIYRVIQCLHTFLQDLKGKFLIKGKRLNKLEVSFADKAASANDTDVTEEEESNDEDEEKEKKSKVCVTSLLFT